jgi:hypothetical protein
MDTTRGREEEMFVRAAVDECKKRAGKTREVKLQRDDVSATIVLTAVATGKKMEVTERDLLSGRRLGTKRAIYFWVRDFV